MWFHRLERILRPAAILLCLAALGLAQTETGQITGVVTDPTGAVVPNAKVSARNVSTKAVRSVTTTASGHYVIANLLPGTYEVTVEAAGFAMTRARVVVNVGARVGFDVRLELGATTEVVEVSAEAAEVVNTETQTIGTTITSQKVLELPSLTRNPYDFVAIAGNISEADPAGRGTGYAINGQRSSSTGVLLDGTGNTDDFRAVVGMSVPLDSVQEFSVLTSNFTAEFGRAAGGIVNVATRSGSNEFHGTLYEFNRVSRLAANTFDNNARGRPKPVFTRNQFGGSLGGPIAKDKLFFFGNIEAIRVRSAATRTRWVPTDELLAAAAANTRSFFSQLGKLKPNLATLRTATKAELLTLGFDPCAGAAAGGPCQQLPANLPMFRQVSYNIPAAAGAGSPQNTYMAVGRVDWNINSRNQMFFRYARESADLLTGSVAESPYAGFDTGETIRNDSYVWSLVQTISPALVSQSKINFNRLLDEQPLGDMPPSPTLYMNRNRAITIAGNAIAMPGYLPFNPGSAIPFGGPQNFLQYYQDLSVVRGSHNLRVGGNFTYLQDNRTFGAFMNSVQVLGTTNGNAMDRFLRGELANFQGAIDPKGAFPCRNPSSPDPTCLVQLPATPPSFSRSNRYKEFALYVQDSWKLARRLTVNLGLRYEYFGVQHASRPELESNFYDAKMGNIFLSIRNGAVATTPNSPVGGLWAPDYNNFAPRLGFAWDVTGDGKTSVRGGWGMAYERNFGNVTFNVIQNPPNYAVISLSAPADIPRLEITTNNFGPLGGVSGLRPLPRTSLRNVDANIRTAYAHFWSFAIERRIASGLIGAVEYSGSAGRKLYSLEDPNLVGAGNAYLGDPCNTGDPFSCTSRLINQYSNLNRRGGKGFSDYHGVNFRLNINNFARSGVYMTVNYTVSKAIDNLSSTFSESANNFNLGLLDPYNPKLDKGLADFDQRQRLSIGGTWEIPYGRTAAHGVASRIFGGWQLAPIITVLSGSPYTIFDCTNAYYWYCPRAMFDGPAPPSPSREATPTANPNTWNYYSLEGLKINSDWVNPITGTAEIGPFPANMSGRNRFMGPGLWHIDLGVYKNFQLTERYRLQFRSEWYSTFNHANLRLVGSDADVSSATFISGQKGGGNDRRNVQLALKLIF
jgi:hypothetical protein